MFRTDPEAQARKDQQRAREQQRKAAEEFRASPAGQARAARRANRAVFQIDLTLSQTTGQVIPMLTAFATSSGAIDAGQVIESIEAEGWKLEHVGYVYRMRGSESRDKFLASGQQEAIHGDIVGIYLFRAHGEPRQAWATEDVGAVDDDGGRTTFVAPV